MAGHKHAALMLQYAQDAAETDRPWERWEFSNPRRPEWSAVEFSHPLWDEDCNYRRKPRTIRIGVFDVPEPLLETPAIGTIYYVPNMFVEKCLWTNRMWNNYESDLIALYRGLIHTTSEAAQQHAIALIALTR